MTNTTTDSLRYIPTDDPCPEWCTDRERCNRYITLDEPGERPSREHGAAGERFLIGHQGAGMSTCKVDYMVTEELYPDGSACWVLPQIFVGLDHPLVSPDEARQVAALLTDAADKLEQGVGTTDSPTRSSLPDPADVETLTRLIDMMADFPSNEQRARYVLSSNWLRDRGPAAAARLGGVA